MSDQFPRWKRTVIAGEIVADDWCLRISEARSVARIRRETGGSNDGLWFWTVQIDASVRPYNAGAGYSRSGAEARQACEDRLSTAFRPTAADGQFY